MNHHVFITQIQQLSTFPQFCVKKNYQRKISCVPFQRHARAWSNKPTQSLTNHFREKFPKLSTVHILGQITLFVQGCPLYGGKHPWPLSTT